MNPAGLVNRLRGLAEGMIEASGGIVEWAPESPGGQAFVSPEVAGCLGQPGETFALSTAGEVPGLAIDLAGNFMDQAGKTLRRFVPACGAFELDDLSVRKSDFDQLVAASFGWQNARARVLSTSVARVACHAWWFHVTLRADDPWESVLQTTINRESGMPVDLGAILPTIRFARSHVERPPVLATLPAAARAVERATMRLAGPFLARIDQRLLADRKRLREYYGAMLRESAQPNRRTRTAPTETGLADRQRVVQLELQRKLAELDERTALLGHMRPVAVAECRIPSAVLDLEVQRKAARRVFRLYWNGLTRCLEPLACSVCGTGAFNLWFSNDTVDPVCGDCHGARQV